MEARKTSPAHLALVLAFALFLPLALTPSAAAASLPAWNLKGAYEHLEPSQLTDSAFVAGLRDSVSLVTVRGQAGGSAGLRNLMENKGEMVVLLYKRGTAVSDADEAFFLANHPTWVLRDVLGAVVKSKAGGTIIDITNPDVRRWLVEQIAVDVPAQGYDGTFLDVLGVYLPPNFYTSRPVDITDTAWRDASIALVNEVRAATGKPVIANGFGIQSGNDYDENKASSDMLIQAADGIQIEHFTRVGNQPAGAFRGIDSWKRDMALLENTNRLGKVVLANTRIKEESDPATIERSQTFALASKLLASSGSTVFQFSPYDLSREVLTTVDSFGTRIGRIEPVRGLIVGTFPGGAVAANNTSSIQVVNLAGTTVTLQPQQAAIIPAG